VGPPRSAVVSGAGVLRGGTIRARVQIGNARSDLESGSGSLKLRSGAAVAR
jgi:hypothetical protein